MIKLIASDMDGTLLNAQMEIPAENIAAIKYAQMKGVEFLVATGRARKESKKILENVGLHTGYINLNGAMVFDTNNKLMVNEPIDRPRAFKIIDILKESGCYFEIVSAEEIYSDSRMQRISNVSDLLVDLNKQLTFKKAVSFAGGSDDVLRISFVKNFKSLFEDMNFQVMKFVAFNPAGPAAFRDIRRQINKLGNLITTASSSNNLEINNVKAQKGIALLDYAKMRGIDNSEVMAIGDNLNDESMIRMAGTGVAMGNAVSQIKDLASFITKNNNDAGVAYAIRHFIK